MNTDSDRGYFIVHPDGTRDRSVGSNVPGEFRQLTEALGGNQLAVTLIRIPPHSDFEQGAGHHHEEIEEIFFVTRGTLTMRLSDEIETVQAPAAVRVAPGTARSHRNEGDQDVEMWAISRQLGRP
jgi:mannose-6-phosphate isomerase-like protein (cupin superfamily)